MARSALRPGGSTTEWRRRRAWWERRLPVPCLRCGEPVNPWDDWHLDHEDARLLGGSDKTARPSHARCNIVAGNKMVAELARTAAKNLRDEKNPPGDDGFFHAQTRETAPRMFLPLPDEAARVSGVVGLAVTDPVWNRASWLDHLRDVPGDATWPRLMTAPHPLAVGSHGESFVSEAEGRTGGTFRWWQRLAAVRLLEHDADERLVWSVFIMSMARQLGKSWWLRELCLWRMHQGDRFGCPQTVLHTGKDISVCKEVQRPARTWAKSHGYKVRETNGQEEITAHDESRWMLRAREAVYGYTADLAAVDEAWNVGPGQVEDGLEPTVAEHDQTQLALVSTAHRKATNLMIGRREDAMAQLTEPDDVLLVEWSAPPDAALDDRDAWRMASPHWTPKREKLLATKLRRAQGGRSDDPDEDDPLESFRAQWLNQWPATAAERLNTRDEPLVGEREWAAAQDLTLSPPSGPYVIAVEDWFGQGASAACAVRDDARVLVWGRTFARRADAYAWVAVVAAGHPDSRLLVGASLDGDEALGAIPVAETIAVGGSQTRAALPIVREALGEGTLAHDGGSELTGQVVAMRVTRGANGLSPSPRGGRTDLARCAAWALADVRRTPLVTDDDPAIF